MEREATRGEVSDSAEKKPKPQRQARREPSLQLALRKERQRRQQRALVREAASSQFPRSGGRTTTTAAIDACFSLRENVLVFSPFFSLTRDRLAEPVGRDLGGRHCVVFCWFWFFLTRKKKRKAWFAVPGKLSCEEASRSQFFPLRLPRLFALHSVSVFSLDERERKRAPCCATLLSTRLHIPLSNVQKSHLRVDPPPDRRWPGQARAPRGPGAGASRAQHHGVLQGFQRRDERDQGESFFFFFVHVGGERGA